MNQFLKFTAAAVLGGTLSLGAYQLMFNSQEVSPSREEANAPFKLTAYGSSPSVPLESIDFVEAANRTVDAVVHVKTTFQEQRYYNPWSQFFGGEKFYSQQQQAAGSGVIISGDGYITTNNHVVQNAASIEIVTNNNRTYSAKLIGRDPATDLALLKIDAENLPAITLGDSDHLRVGEWVLAVGNPFNLTSTVTAGIVSAKSRNINILDYNPTQDVFPLESFIQTDAAVNPGNSGGALVNGRGELVGINTAIASQTGSYSGYSFAIPVSIVKKVTADLLEYGKVQRAYIGVNISNIDPTLREEEGLKVSEGAYVRGLLEGGAAAEAGLKAGDIIVAVENIAVHNVTELQEQVGKYRPGDKIKVALLREGDQKELIVLLRDRYGNTEIAKIRPGEANKILGATFRELTDQEMSRYNISNGVRVENVQSGKLQEVGLQPGFIITHIDKQAVDSPEEVTRILGSKQGGTLVEGVHPNGMPDYYGFGL